MDLILLGLWLLGEDDLLLSFAAANLSKKYRPL